MNRRLIYLSCAFASATLLAACDSAPKDAGYDDVRDLISDRTGLTVHWNAQTPDDAAVADAINKILGAKMTADQAAQIALLNNHHLQATFENLGIAQSDLVQAGLLKNPVFDLGVRFPDHAPAGTYLDIGVTEDFLDIALIPARKRLAAAQFEEAKARVSNEVLMLVAQTRADFCVYQAAEQTLDLRRTEARISAASLEAAHKLHDVGNLTDLALANERAQNARGKIDLSDAEASAAEAREKVSSDMALSDSQTMWTAARLPETIEPDFPDQNLESLALKQRQDLAAARKDVLAQAQALGMTSDFRFFSELNLGPEFERETDGQWRIGPTLSLPLPLFDQGQAKITRAQSMLRQSEQRCLALAMDIQSQVRTARVKLSSARKKALLYRDEVLPAEREVMHQMELQYNGMYVGVLQLLQAKREQIDASRQFIESLRDYWIARAELEQALGGRLPSPTSTTQPEPNGGPQ
ncbi:MAG TPA: TolC family protein [Tepidisphaeraceae bacterium]|jgi:cobalt-zinc-cadmium efflux system outer membrane protein